ncbi:uncharacterized protein EI97DRAFT_499053 [Westerdykella ornata]|uniref:BTB domain-containing protein n=1 Tax=Westerdykella ornata TaxID=318751 RepID=A0A6A6JSQ5_WESOR|nr:uncharacterized protein EI97DRAFT_499053 [Westerdykella ornata]KAF2279641.1 hypothetical protein EI97DRAFT_499053 [Westerdykella ornata]
MEAPSKRPKMDGSSKKTPCFADYFNSSRFSDVKIRFGDVPHKQMFPGHAVILCVQSEWFEKALNGGFKESETRVIDVKGDDPLAFNNMLKFIYGIRIPELTSTFTLGSLMSSVRLWGVADKYDVPALRKEVEKWWSESLPIYIHDLYRRANQGDDPPLQKKLFTKVVLGIFDSVSEGAEHMKDPLLQVLFRTCLQRDTFFSKSIDSQVPTNGISLLQDAVRKSAEFSQCLLLYIHDARNGAQPIVNSGGNATSGGQSLTIAGSPDEWEPFGPFRSMFPPNL